MDFSLQWDITNNLYFLQLLQLLHKYLFVLICFLELFVVSLQNFAFQTLQFYFLLFRTFFNYCAFYFIFPSFPVLCFCLQFLLSLSFTNLRLFLLLSLLSFVRLIIFFRRSVLPPMFVHLTDATDMGFVIISSESFWTVNTNESCRSTSSQNVAITLFFLQSYITIFTNKSHHFCCWYL
mgnify:CR=1 FL=1